MINILLKMLITSMAGIIELKAIIVTLKNLKGYINIELTIERLYKHRVDDYIKNKYPQYHNGK